MISDCADAVRADLLSHRIGIGARLPHFAELLAAAKPTGFVELLADNHLESGSPTQELAIALAKAYTSTLHCVGMSLGSPDPLDRQYLTKVRRLGEQLGAMVVSDHCAFTRLHGQNYHDLLPLPHTTETLNHLCARISQAQDLLGRRLAIENGSRYVEQPDNAMPESEFLQALCERTDCRLILDINNAYVNQVNLGEPAANLIFQIPDRYIAYLHVAGHQRQDARLLDTHGAPVAEEVLMLLKAFMDRAPGMAICLEWDRNLPGLPMLLTETKRIQTYLEANDACRAA